MARKGHENLSRTSVQLPLETLEMLDARWPGLTRSEALRLALERFEYFDWQSKLCDQIIQKYGHDLTHALADFDYSDFKAVARALPNLVLGYIRDEGAVTKNVDEKDLERTLEMLEPHDRLQILDFAVAQRHSPVESGD